MLRASGVAAELDAAAVPVIDGVRDLVEAGAVAGGSQRNLDDTDHVDWAGVTPTDSVVLCDAQTSGGLLLAVPPDLPVGGDDVARSRGGVGHRDRGRGRVPATTPLITFTDGR